MFQNVLRISSTLFLVPPLFLLRTLITKPLSLLTYYSTLPFKHLLYSAVRLAVWFGELLKSFETIIIFVGVAATIGLIGGLILHGCSHGLESTLHIGKDNDQRPKQDQPIRTLESWRTARQRKKQQAMIEEQRKASTVSRRIRDALHASSRITPFPTWSQTILEEEEDSEF